MPYIFYDTETTGVETRFDQILQFAAIKTDDELNEIDSFEIRCRLLPHVVPSPGALMTTRVTPDMLVDKLLPSHYEAVRKIRATLSAWSPATFIGFNSLAFDEELFRSTLFQTLHSPYLTNTQGNRRSDVMRIAHAASAFAPGSIVVPQNGGKDTFRLDKLAPANGYNFTNAHDALADVRATIYIANHIRKAAPDVWKAMDGFSRKDAVMNFVDQNPTFTMMDRFYGKAHSWIVAPCGTNANNSNQVVVFDLAYDPDAFKNKSVEELIDVMNSNHKAIRTFRANAQPILMSEDDAPEGTKSLALSKAERLRRSKLVLGDDDFKERVCEAAENRFADQEKSTYVEEQIYDGFANEDEPLMEKFHTLDWPKRYSALSGFKDVRISELANRLVFFEHPDAFDKAKRDKLNAWMDERISTNDDVPWMTTQKAIDEADKMLVSAEGAEVKALKDMKRFFEDFPKVMKHPGSR